MPIAKSLLLSKASSYTQAIHESMDRATEAGLKKSAFLCHSHKDEDIVKGLIVLLRESGIDLYVDWKDPSMPEIANAETARKIQAQIRRHQLFYFLATANSKSSRWCPWEIGYADSSSKAICIIQTFDDGGTYGNEYLQLYSRIDFFEYQGRKGFAKFAANEDKGAWLSASNL